GFEGHGHAPGRHDVVAVGLECVRLAVHGSLHFAAGQLLVRNRGVAEIAFREVHLPLARVGRIGCSPQSAGADPDQKDVAHGGFPPQPRLCSRDSPGCKSPGMAQPAGPWRLTLPMAAWTRRGKAEYRTAPTQVCNAYIMGEGVFEWDGNNLRKIRAHRIKREEVEQTLLNDPIPIYEQDFDGELRFVYYGQTNAGRLLAVIVTERGENLRVITAYDLDAGQKREYLRRRLQGE